MTEPMFTKAGPLYEWETTEAAKPPAQPIAIGSLVGWRNPDASAGEAGNLMRVLEVNGDRLLVEHLVPGMTILQTSVVRLGDVCACDTAKPPEPKRRRRRVRDIPPAERGGKAGFEFYLRSLGLPFVVVDEAKKAIFARSDLDAFHFLVYCDDGPNYLIHVVHSMPTAKQEALLSEWQKVFGADFVGVFVKSFPGGNGPWVYLRNGGHGPWAPYPPEAKPANSQGESHE